MAEVQLSKNHVVGVVWGQHATFTGVSALKGKLTEANDSKSSKTWEELIDPATGEVQALVIAGQMTELSLTVVPSDDSITKSKSANILPTIGEIVSITDLYSADQATAVQFIVKSASRSRGTGRNVTISMNLVRYEENFSATTA